MAHCSAFYSAILPAIAVLLLGCPDATESAEANLTVAPAASGKARPSSIGSLEALRKKKAKLSAARIVNPSGAEPYSGPVGSVSGTVTVVGDPPPLSGAKLESLAGESCDAALGMYRKLFRKGPAETLADVLVAVTGYKGYLPPKTDVVPVKIKQCAWNSRTVAMTVGQHLNIINLDPKPYMPRLAGAPTPALRVVMAGGAPVPLFAPKPGAYQLLAETRPYMKADVFVVAYPTTAVTRLDGRFEVKGLPPGEVTVTAFSPAIGIRQQVNEKVTIEAGKTATVNLQIEFSAKDYKLQKKPMK